MKKNILSLIILLSFLITGCSEEKETEIVLKSKTPDTIKEQQTVPVDSVKTKKSDKIYVTRIEKFIKISELQDDIAKDIIEYTGMYTADIEGENAGNDAAWEDLIIEIKDKEISANINYYQNGKKTDELILKNVIIGKNILTANLIRNGKAEMFNGRFVKLPYITEETDFIYGFLVEREGKYILYEAEY